MVDFLRAFGAEPILHARGTLRDMPFCPALDGTEPQPAQRWRDFVSYHSGISSALRSLRLLNRMLALPCDQEK